MGDFDQVALHVLPVQAKAFVGSDSAVQKNRSRVAQQEWIARFGWNFAPLGSPDAIKRPLLHVQGVKANSLSRFGVRFLILRTRHMRMEHQRTGRDAQW